jgi:REP element-mobilizing transposase RayT
MAIFSEPSDYAPYRDLIAERLARHHVVCWAYCLMPNHVHFILAPPQGEAPTASAAISRSVGGWSSSSLIPFSIHFPRILTD